MTSVHDWDICPVCFWEDDVILGDRDSIASPANRGISVAEAQANFIIHGVVDPRLAGHVRPPTADEARDPSWRPLDKALENAGRGRSS
jgi:Cysteine-rich CPCC